MPLSPIMLSHPASPEQAVHNTPAPMGQQAPAAMRETGATDKREWWRQTPILTSTAATGATMLIAATVMPWAAGPFVFYQAPVLGVALAQRLQRSQTRIDDGKPVLADIAAVSCLIGSAVGYGACLMLNVGLVHLAPIAAAIVVVGCLVSLAIDALYPRPAQGGGHAPAPLRAIDSIGAAGGLAAAASSQLTLADLDVWADAPDLSTLEHENRQTAKAVILRAAGPDLGARLKAAPLQLSGDLDLSKLLYLRDLPEGLRVGGKLELQGCRELIALPDDLFVQGSLDLRGCLRLEALPEEMFVGEDLQMHGCTSIERLPDDFRPGKSWYLQNCTALSYIPDDLHIRGTLDLTGCRSLFSLPSDLMVDLHLSIRDCVNIRALSEGLQVRGDLNASGCVALTRLNERLAVGSNLILSGCTALTRLPEVFAVNGDVHLDDCHALVHLAAVMTQWKPRPDGAKRMIYLTGSGVCETTAQALQQLCRAEEQQVTFERPGYRHQSLEFYAEAEIR